MNYISYLQQWSILMYIFQTKRYHNRVSWHGTIFYTSFCRKLEENIEGTVSNSSFLDHLKRPFLIFSVTFIDLKGSSRIQPSRSFERVPLYLNLLSRFHRATAYLLAHQILCVQSRPRKTLSFDPERDEPYHILSKFYSSKPLRCPERKQAYSIKQN